jgi:hypothetical protein
MDWIRFFSMQGVAALSALSIFVIGCDALLVISLFIIDLSQTRDAVRHNFPVVGRFPPPVHSALRVLSPIFLCHGQGRDAFQPGGNGLGLPLRSRYRLHYSI